jgi:hypothetical protein
MIYPVFNEVSGKKTHGNPITQPKGSVRVCENWETTRDNVYRIPRGRDEYGKTSLLPNSTVQVPMQYDNRLFLHYLNNEIYYDANGNGDYVQVLDATGAGIFQTPDANHKIEYLENANNLYITTSTGLMKLDTLGGVMVQAGAPKGLSSDIRLITPGAGEWLSDGNYVAYRHLWSVKDANNNKIVGAPSERQEVQNTTGVDTAVEHRIYIPDGVSTQHMLELYRTTDGATSQPENHQLVYQINPSAADIANGFMIVEDITPASFRGAKLYTNTTQEGIDQANEIPPLARTIDRYKNFVFYANINNLHRLYTSLISVVNLVAGTSSITFDNGTVAFTMGCYAPNAGNIVTGMANAAGLIRVTIGAGHTLVSGDYVRIYDVTGTVEANGIWEINVINATTFDLIGSAFVNAWVAGGTVDRYEDLGATPRFILETGGTTAQNIDATSRSIIRCLNQCTPNTYLYGYIVSNADDPPGKMMFTNRTLVDDNFYLIVNNAATGGSFSPIIPTAGTDYTSTNDRLQNAYMWSKANEGEAVPLVNIDYVGSSNDPILKVVGLRDSVIFIKEKEGIFQLTGEAAPFNVDEFDGTVKCLQPDSVAKGQNSIFMMSNLGYVRISSAGVEVIGRDNEYKDLKPILNVNYNLSGKGWFYEDDKIYKTATMDDENSTSKDIVKVYNVFNRSWRDEIHGVYTGDGHVAGGIIIDGLEYTYNVTGRGIYRERKSFTVTDHATPDVDVTIAAVDAVANTVTLTANITVPIQSILEQTVGLNTFSKVIIEPVNNTNVIQLNNVNNLVAGGAVVVPGIESILEYNPVHCGSPFVEKFLRQLMLQFDADETSIENIFLEIRTDKDDSPIEIAMTDLPTNFWGLEWSGIFGTYNVVDKFLTWATKEHSRCTMLYIKVRHTAARKQCALAGFAVDFEAISEGRNKVR